MSTKLNFVFSDKAMKNLNDLADGADIGLDTVIAHALSLYAYLVRERDKGNKVLVHDRDNELDVKEVTIP